MLSPLPRRSGWASCFAHSPIRVSLPRYGRRVGLRIILYKACSAFTRVTACTLALSPIRDTLTEGFSHFVTSMTAPVASGWSGRRMGLTPTGKRRLSTAHTHCRRIVLSLLPLFFCLIGLSKIARQATLGADPCKDSLVKQRVPMANSVDTPARFYNFCSDTLIGVK